MLLRWRSHLSRYLSLALIAITTFMLAFGLSSLIGSGAVSVEAAEPAADPAAANEYGMVDPVDARYEAGYSIYVQQCATCHVALPPAVLPADTWQALVTDASHYGTVLPAFTQFDQQLMLNYLRAYSLRHQGSGALPYRLENSRYFQALHPNVSLPQPLNLRSCASCHLSAGEQDYSLGTNSGV